jgi:hypothetical protein
MNVPRGFAKEWILQSYAQNGNNINWYPQKLIYIYMYIYICIYIVYDYVYVTLHYVMLGCVIYIYMYSYIMMYLHALTYICVSWVAKPQGSIQFEMKYY